MITNSSDEVSSEIRHASSSAANTTFQKQSHFVISKCRRNTDVNVNEENAGAQETSEDSEVEDRVLATYCRAGKLGAAYYTLQTGELFVLEELADRAPEFQMFVALHRQVAPVCVLLEGRSQGAFVQLVKKTLFCGEGDEHAGGKCRLVFLSAKEYSFEACKRRIFSLSLPHEPPNASEQERTLFLRTVLDFNQTHSVHALGALLRYLDLNWSNLAMELQSKPQFLSLRIISLADIVMVDEDTYRGLQIFSAVAHPSAFKKGARGSSREGLSLLLLLNRCSSKLGQNRMRLLLQHPTTELATLARRQDVIAFFMRPQNDALMRNICASLRYIKNVNGILAKIQTLSAKPYQWKSLYNTLYNAVLICEMCESTGSASEFLQQLACCDNNKLYEMALYMNRIIDFDLSKSEGKFTVKAGVDKELDMKKQTLASLHGLMSETARVELARLPARVRECSMLYLPHLGYLLAVKAWADQLTAADKQLPHMKFMNNEYIHYKSKGCEELDVMIGDTYPEIVSHETRIMMRLASLLLHHLHTLADVVDKCAELDCLIALSKVSKEYNFVRPTLTTERVLSIQQGWHPLLGGAGAGAGAGAGGACVPNDFESGAGAACVNVLTGPNSSGKSLYIKQVGLIVYLAHIGCFVPARAARVGVVRRLHSRLHGAECVAQHMSAFLIDLRQDIEGSFQMSLALQDCPGQSLVLVDEFGRGTARADGPALLAACLLALLARPAACPHLLLATHYHYIHQYILDTPLLRFLRFEYIVEDGEPVFLYRVCEAAPAGAGGQGGRGGGHSGQGSLALQVAAAAGLPGKVIDRAGQIMDAVMNNSLPPENKRISAKLKSCIEMIKNDILTNDI